MMQSVRSGIFLLSLCVATSWASAQTTSQIRLNQIGFYPEGPKTAAVVDFAADSFYVTTPDLAHTVFAGALTGARTWSAAGESVRRADFSELRTEGEYVISVPGLGKSYPFLIQEHVHQDVARAAVKAYYFNRASTSLHPAFAGRWARSAGHPDTSVIVHSSAASAGRPEGTVISAPRGWYDAGDYNKYVVNSGISVGTLLMLYEHYPRYFAELETNIPESGNGVPDLLDEVLWNLRWMLSMQDPEDGGVYHKLTTPNFEGAVMPSRALQPRYVVQKGTAASLNFSAVMAMAARIYDDYGAVYPGLSDSMLSAAGRAWDWAQENPETAYRQSELNGLHDPDINTGEYGNGSFFDEFRWAAAELFVTTGRDSFLVMYPPYSEPSLATPSWPNVGTLAFVTLVHHRLDAASAVDTTEINDRLIRLANEYIAARRESPYDMVMGKSGDFFWGSNSHAANQGVILMQAYRLTGDDRYLHAALSNLDYLLGRNATGYSFVTGHGDRTPMNIHHRQSEADGIRDPVPGFLAGGPNSGRQDRCTYPSTQPAKSYVDSWCSYASNEVTINWNAPLAYLAGAIEATLSPTGMPVSAPSSGRARTGEQDLHFTFYPNPALREAHVSFEIREASRVRIAVHDLLGREVAVLVEETVAPGRSERILDVRSFAAGVYLLTLDAGTARKSKSLVVLR